MGQGLLNKLVISLLQNALAYSEPTYIVMNSLTIKRKTIIPRHYHVSGR